MRGHNIPVVEQTCKSTFNRTFKRDIDSCSSRYCEIVKGPRKIAHPDEPQSIYIGKQVSYVQFDHPQRLINGSFAAPSAKRIQSICFERPN